MLTNKIFIVATITCLFLATTSLTCNKRIGCSDIVYSFSINVKAYPDKEIFSVGDTLWLEAKTPTLLKDEKTGQLINYSGSENLGTDINYDEMLGNHESLPSADSFDHVFIHGEFVPDNLNVKRNKDYRFTEINQLYQFKLGIIMKKKGIFKIAIGNANNVYRKNEKCTKAFFRVTFNETNQHLHLYQQNRPGYVLSEYDKTHIYAFKVV